MALDLNNPEVKAEVDAMIAAQVAEATKGLVNKNAELGRKLKMASEIKPEDYQRALEEADTLRTQAADAQREAKELKSATKKLTEAVNAKQIVIEKTLIDDALTNALVQQGVRPEFLGAVKALHRSNAKVTEDGDGYKAMLGDKPIADAVAEWASSETGKHFVAAPANQGGGASGSRAGSGGPKKVTQAEFNAMDAAARKEGIQKGTLIIEG